MADSDGSPAIDNAIAKLRALSAGGGGGQAPVSPYRIPVKTGRSYDTPINRGMFDDDINTVGKTGKQKHEVVDRFELTEEGVNAAIGSWYAFDDDDRKGLMQRMWFLGLLKDPNDFDGGFRAWKVAVDHAARFASTGREMDPRDMLELLADGEAGPGTKEKAGPVTRRQIDLTDPTTAQEWVQQAFKQSMGRRAEEAEVRALVDALHTEQRANPTVSTDTPTKWDANGNPIDSTNTTTGGVNPEAFFASRMAADPEAGAHQAAAELYPALLQALQGL